MTVVAPPWLTTAGPAVAVLIVLAASALLVARTMRTMTRTTALYCPVVGRRVVVQSLIEDERPVAVLRCSGLPDSTDVRCGMWCLGGGPGLPGRAEPKAVFGLLDG